jgi:hypothetical protein
MGVIVSTFVMTSSPQHLGRDIAAMLGAEYSVADEDRRDLGPHVSLAQQQRRLMCAL